MTSKTALFALLAMWGVGLGGALPARAEDPATEGAAAEAKADCALPETDGLTNRVWIKTDDGEQPGVRRIFMSDGTFVQENAWEAHRLSTWKMLPGDRLSWNEDGIEIAAHIQSLTTENLTLVLDRKGGSVTETYAAAQVPYFFADLSKA